MANDTPDRMRWAAHRLRDTWTDILAPGFITAVVARVTTVNDELRTALWGLGGASLWATGKFIWYYHRAPTEMALEQHGMVVSERDQLRARERCSPM